MINVLWLSTSAPALGGPRPPSLFVSIETRLHSSEQDIVVSRLASAGRGLKGTFVSREAFPPTLGPGGGAVLLRPDPGRPRLAIETRSADTDAAQVDLWSLAPLRRTATIRFNQPGHTWWLPGTGLLAIVDQDGSRPRTRLVRPDGKIALAVPGGFGALADPARGRCYVAQWPTSGEQLTTANPWYEGAIESAMKNGRVRFRVLQGGTIAGDATPPAVKNLIVGPNGTLANLAFLLSPLREVTGYGRTWAVARAGVPPGIGPGGIRLVSDLLGFPKRRALFTRGDVDDIDSIVSVTTRGRGAMTFSGRATASLRRPHKGAEWTAAWIDGGKRREWFLAGKSMARGVFLWID